MIYRPDTGEILGVHILGLHAADLIHEASNAMALGTKVQVHAQLFWILIILGDIFFSRIKLLGHHSSPYFFLVIFVTV